MYRMVFTQILRRIIYVVACGLLVSCTTYRTLRIETFQPAQIPIEPGKRLGLFERNMVYDHKSQEFWLSDKIVTKMGLFEQFANGLKNVLAEAGRLDSLTTLAEGATTVLLPPANPSPYPADSVRNLCQKFNLDYIIAIELLYYDKIDRQIRCNWYMRLYSNTTSAPIDSVVLVHDLRLPDDYDTPEEFVYEILGAAWDKGGDYARRIVPSWVISERRIYNKGKILRLGDSFFKVDDLEKAMRIWEGAWNMSAGMALKAGINLAYMYENGGDYQAAISVLNQTEEKIKGKKVQHTGMIYLQKYKQLLYQQIEKNKLLEKQFISTKE